MLSIGKCASQKSCDNTTIRDVMHTGTGRYWEQGGATDEFREKRWRPWVHVARVKGPASTGPRPERSGPW